MKSDSGVKENAASHSFHLASYNWIVAKNSCSVIYFHHFTYMLNIDASETCKGLDPSIAVTIIVPPT